jgi:hypothetical protein
MASLLMVDLSQAQGTSQEILPSALPRSHAHNDYWNKHPLFDALNLGFRSIEVDVHLLMNDLFVAHTILGIRWNATLEELYLKPLQDHISRNNGQVFTDGTQLILFIDIKSKPEPTYRILKQQLARYSPIVQIFGLDEPAAKPVMIIISGNRPKQQMRAEKIRYAACDGRYEDLLMQDPDNLVPVISEKWSRLFTWKGYGKFPSWEKDKLRQIVNAAHKHGQWIRFWAIPDASKSIRQAIWEVLFDAGVDFINTDDLPGLHQFFILKLQATNN